jgi:chromosome segregation protein
MKLVRLELSGFKSFADTVELPFDDGVTAIVGPNGCGKSNVSDAVRWVLGEQSPRLLRGSKMEDVIFQGSTGRRPVSVAEVSLVFDNSDGTLPLPQQEVVVTRRLSRSGVSDYLINRDVVRLRDVQDLLRGTGLGAGAAVVMEAKMIDALLSEKAEERRELFEEAAGIGLYRDRKRSTERRLEETGQDLSRLGDLISEVQTQVRSLARQRGKAERFTKMLDERFGVALTLARSEIAELDAEIERLAARAGEVEAEEPALRARLAEEEHVRETRLQQRHTAEARRTEVERRLAEARLEISRLEGDLTLAAERLANAASRRTKAAAERGQAAGRAAQAERERGAAAAERTAAERDLGQVKTELSSREQREQECRDALATRRQAVREQEEELQRVAERVRALEGERTALDAEVAELREEARQATAQRETLERDRARMTEQANRLAEKAEEEAQATTQAAADVDRLRHALAEARERDARRRTERRQAEETLAQLAARRDALADLDRERVGLAPAASALLAVRGQFGSAVVGPLSDFVHTSRADADLAERLLGEWLHAVVVRDAAAVTEIQTWHAETQPGPLALLPLTPGPRRTADGDPFPDRLRVDGPAVAWVRALLTGQEVLEADGRALRRANGAVFLAAAAAAAGPLKRRADLEALGKEVADAQKTLERAEAAVTAATADLSGAERALQAAMDASDARRGAEREVLGKIDDAARIAAHLSRQAEEAGAKAGRLAERLTRAQERLAAVHKQLDEGELERARLDNALTAGRASFAEQEAEHETAREQRVHWAVEAAQVEARLQAAAEREQRAGRQAEEALALSESLVSELSTLESDTGTLTAQRAQWEDAVKERRAALVELESATREAGAAVAEADQAVEAVETALGQHRHSLEEWSHGAHQVELQRADLSSRRRAVVDRVETEWRKPYEQLAREAPEVEGNLETLREENERLREALEAVGPVNHLAVDEHAEEMKRLEHLMTQRDDVVAARSSLQQAVREIDHTARAMFLDSFSKVRENFRIVFQTLFGGGECDVRLVNADDPLESEIEISAAPRGKRTQRIHLLSSGERTLVATSLLFSIFLTKPSPFCLLDEVDAPLDDANVGRYVRLLSEFKEQTQFIVITHNPRTMQAADAVYGVTMQEPGVSTIVGVRLGALERV